MAFYSYDGSGTRTVKQKGDIEDLITNLDLKNTPLYSTLSRRKVHDHNPQTLADSLASVDTANYHAQGAAAPSASDTSRTVIQNECQILFKTWEVSDSQQEVAQYGMASEKAYQKAKKLVELRRDIEAFMLSDQSRQAPTAANSYIGKMDGVSTIISTTTNNTFSQANFDSDMATVVAAGGLPTVAYMDATRKIAVGAWTTTPTRYTTDIKMLESEVLVFHSDLGEKVTMLWHHLMPQDIGGSSGAHLICIQPDLWQVCEFIRLFHKDLPDTGGGPSGTWKTSVAPLCRAEEGNMLFN